MQQLYSQGVATHVSASPKVGPTTSCTSGLSCGLVGYWTFDGKDTPWTSSSAATTLDKSGNGNTGTLTNMLQSTAPVPGKIGQALKFDGSSGYVDIGTNSSLHPANITVSFWIKPNTISGTLFLLNEQSSSPYYGYATYFDGGLLYWELYTAGAGTYIDASTTNLVSNSWQYITETVRRFTRHLICQWNPSRFNLIFREHPLYCNCEYSDYWCIQ